MSQTPQPGLIQTGCEVYLDACMVEYAKVTGGDTTVICAGFNALTGCFRTHLPTCNTAEYTVYEEKFNEEIMQLPAGCALSTTPYDVGANSVPSSGSSAQSSSGIVVPPSGTSGGRTSGSSSLYMNWWQWVIFASCCFCCCLGAIIPVCMRRRNRMAYGPYQDPYMDPYGGGGFYGDPYYPEAVPLSAPMPYTASMPTAVNMY